MRVNCGNSNQVNLQFSPLQV
uniref:Uncharacterized protein n=1 Tax=Anguilla anguilla TaxID=7936 RepID=A0A0E9P9H3_ANGAN